MIVAVEELDLGDVSDMEEPLLVQDMVRESHLEDENDTSSIDSASMRFKIMWSPPVSGV
jgi:hypothetical protein